MEYDNSVEKRRFVRAKFPCRIKIYFPKEHIVLSSTRNIGAGGIRVIVEEKLEVSSIVGLDIYLEDEPISCKGRVVWSVEYVGHADDSPKCNFFYDTGIEFAQISEEDRNVVSSFVKAVIAKEK